TCIPTSSTSSFASPSASVVAAAATPASAIAANRGHFGADRTARELNRRQAAREGPPMAREGSAVAISHPPPLGSTPSPADGTSQARPPNPSRAPAGADERKRPSNPRILRSLRQFHDDS